jgi:phosphate:Na+ symporter
VQKAWQHRDRVALDAVLKMDDKVDILHEAILEYLGEIRRETLTDHQSGEFQALMAATVNLEGLADVIETDLVGLGKRVIDQDLKPDETTRILFLELADKVTQAVKQVIKSIRDSDEQAAADVIAIKDEVRRLSDEALARQTETIGVAETRNIDLIRLEFEILDNLRRIYTLAKRIAKDFVPEEVAEKA